MFVWGDFMYLEFGWNSEENGTEFYEIFIDIHKSTNFFSRLLRGD